jgi:hypothetical protein
MTVSFLFGWQHILTGLGLLIAVAVIFLLVLGAGVGRSGQGDWRAELDARSRGYRQRAIDPDDDTADPVSSNRMDQPSG